MDYKQLFKDIFTLNFKPFKVRFFKLTAKIFRFFFGSRTISDYNKVPIIINNRNRLTYLKQLIKWLEKNGYSNIYILDNNSTYEPLINYYKECSYKVYFLNENVGHLAFWKTGIYKHFQKHFYVYTDSDVVPISDCPSDVIEHLFQILSKYPQIEKVGLGLKIDDLPDHYEQKTKVIEWESKFWNNEIEKDLYKAQVDTTFALYKPYTNSANYFQNGLRTGGKYMLHHLPWYEDSKNLSDESLFYHQNIKQGASHWIVNKK